MSSETWLYLILLATSCDISTKSIVGRLAPRAHNPQTEISDPESRTPGCVLQKTTNAARAPFRLVNDHARGIVLAIRETGRGNSSAAGRVAESAQRCEGSASAVAHTNCASLQKHLLPLGAIRHLPSRVLPENLVANCIAWDPADGLDSPRNGSLKPMANMIGPNWGKTARIRVRTLNTKTLSMQTQEVCAAVARKRGGAGVRNGAKKNAGRHENAKTRGRGKTGAQQTRGRENAGRGERGGAGAGARCTTTGETASRGTAERAKPTRANLLDTNKTTITLHSPTQRTPTARRP